MEFLWIGHLYIKLRALPCRFLIKNELLFVAEREIEVHIWKVVYYQVLSSLFMFSH